MPFNFYNAYLSVSQTPSQEFTQDFDNLMKQEFEYASTYKNVLLQQGIGSSNYIEYGVRLTSLIDPKTGNNFGDEWRKIIFNSSQEVSLVDKNGSYLYDKNDNALYVKFPVLNFKRLGIMSYFENSYWLVVNTNTRVGATSSIFLRKCNNYLKWVDSYNILHSWNCVVVRDLSNDSSLDFGSKNTSPEIKGTTKILIQRNIETNTIQVNQRFILDGFAFKVTNINNHFSQTLLEIDIASTPVLEEIDDLINNIANAKNIAPNTNTDKILPQQLSLYIGDTQTYTVYNYDNSNPTLDTFTIIVNNASSVPSANYNFNVINSNSFSVECLGKNVIPLDIQCTNNQTQVQTHIYINLSGNW